VSVLRKYEKQVDAQEQVVALGVFSFLDDNSKSAPTGQRSYTMNNWQEGGIRLAGMLVYAMEIIQEALPHVRNRAHRREIQRYLAGGGKGAFPSPEALRSLEAGIIASRMMSQNRDEQGR